MVCGDNMAETFLEIDVTDEIMPLLQRMTGNYQKSLKSAAKSLGWFMQKEIKEGVRSGEPGGQIFVERRPYEVRAALGDGKAARAWYGRMIRAIGYQYDDGTLRIGWTSKTAARYGEKQEFGYDTKVTDEIRKRFERAGYPLRKSTKVIHLPERPIFEPMKTELEPQIAPYVTEKLDQYNSENVAFSKKARKKYKVYG